MLAFGLITIVFIILFFALHKMKSKIKSILRIILIVIALEVYIFNCNSFRLKFKEYTEKTFNTNDLTIENADYENNSYILNRNGSYIEVNNIEAEVGTLKLDIELDDEEALDYRVYYTDETSKDYRELPLKTLVNNVERSKYVTCYLSGKSTQITVSDIKINEDVPFNFNILRVLFLVTITLLIYELLNGKIFKMPYSSNNIIQVTILSIIVAMMALFTIWISNSTDFNSSLYEKINRALRSGQINLIEAPTQKLLSLDNPYDNTERSNTTYVWDIALYNNKYYPYFGILPFLLLPFLGDKIFHVFVSAKFGILIFTLITMIALTKIIILLYKKWFKNLNFNYLVLAIIGTISGSLIFWVNRRPDVYEFVLTSAVCFSSLGIWFMFKAIQKEEIKYRYLVFSSICLAAAVTCRPNHLIVSLIFLPKIIQILIKNIKERKNIAKLILSVSIPYILFGIFQMVYNYVRFENIFEFGAKYQLTVNDMRNLKNRVMSIPTGVLTQLISLPKVTGTFPFFEYQYDSQIPFFGYYYVYRLVCGLFILNPINFLLVFLIGLKKKIVDKEAYNNICLMTIVGLILCIFNVAVAGTLQRYSMDYAWLLNIASYLTLFIIVNKIQSKEIKKYILKITIIITFFMLIINSIIGGLVSENGLLESSDSSTFYKMRYSICFWE